MKPVKPSRTMSQKTRILFVLSFISLLLGLSLFVLGILLAFFYDGSIYYLLAFGGLPLLWLGSFLWRSARHVPFSEDLPSTSGSITCCAVDPYKPDAKNDEK